MLQRLFNLFLPLEKKERQLEEMSKQKLISALPKFKKTVVNTSPEVATAAIELQYYFGRRGTDLFKFLKAKDLNTKTGQITLSSAKRAVGVRVEQTFPLREILPDLYKKLVKLKSQKSDADLLISNNSGKQININKLIEVVFKDANIKSKLFGGKKNLLRLIGEKF